MFRSLWEFLNSFELFYFINLSTVNVLTCFIYLFIYYLLAQQVYKKVSSTYEKKIGLLFITKLQTKLHFFSFTG